MLIKVFWYGVAAALLAGIISLAVGIGAVIMQWAWNMVIAGLFNGPELTFWHAVAVNVMIGLVWKGVSVTINGASR